MRLPETIFFEQMQLYEYKNLCFILVHRIIHDSETSVMTNEVHGHTYALVNWKWSNPIFFHAELPTLMKQGYLLTNRKWNL